MRDAAAALAEFAPQGTPSIEVEVPRWTLPRRLAFRFFAVYFGLYVLTTQMIGGFIPFQVDLSFISDKGPVLWMVNWTAAHVFGATLPLVVTGSGSGDKTFDWVHAFCFLIIALAITVAWSIAARRTENHVTAHKWYRLFLRFALGTTMLSYGAAKVIPLQMSFPSLIRLLEPYGNFSPMGVLWASIGASRPYEIFTGAMEISAAVLLFIPRTALLGALVALCCTVEIFTLNMTYDVPVKLFSFHLIVMSLFLLAPDMQRLADVLVLNRTAEPSAAPPLGKTPKSQRIWTIAQLVFGVWLIGAAIQGSIQAWSTYGGGAPKSPLYGVWNVMYMSLDGVERPPLLTDYERWRRVVFDRPTQMSFVRMDDTVVSVGSTIDEGAKSINLTKPADQKWAAAFSFERPAPDRMTLSGEMDGRRIQMRLKLFPRENFLLVTRGFNWVQEYPFNR
jgi:hypothetical protein